jgi:hypothetical protein
MSRIERPILTSGGRGNLAAAFACSPARVAVIVSTLSIMAELYDMELDGFLDLVREIKGQGVDEATAARWAGLIGDTPALDERGKVLVMDGGKVIARLEPLRCLG